MPERPMAEAKANAFPRTRWSVVLTARGESSAEAAGALETICSSYWYPLYAYARRCGYSSPDAQDLTQEFFSRLLKKRWLETADREKGRLRTFLIVALKRFMAKEWRHAAAQRRGGGQAHLPIDTAFAESRYAAATCNTLEPDGVFDQEWALTLLDLTLKRLQNEFALLGKPGEFEILKSCLMAARGTIDYAEMARRLAASEGAARVAVHRLRKRFREVFREGISQTLANDTDLQGELRLLAQTLAREAV